MLPKFLTFIWEFYENSPQNFAVKWRMEANENLAATLINSRIYGYVRGNTINLSSKMLTML
jgi:hypothetical protein